jgi:hypothetical protein
LYLYNTYPRINEVSEESYAPSPVTSMAVRCSLVTKLFISEPPCLAAYTDCVIDASNTVTAPDKEGFPSNAIKESPFNNKITDSS